MASLNEERGEQKFTPTKSLKRTLAERHSLDWLRKERKLYADVKYPMSTVEANGGNLTQEDIDFVMQYLKRAQLQGLNTPQGRQNLGKAASTLYHFMQGAVICHGPMPEPGYPSGELVSWTNGPTLDGD